MLPRPGRRAWQAAERLLNMNEPEKGGSAYLYAKVTNARNTLVAPKEEPEPAPEPPKPEPPKKEE